MNSAVIRPSTHGDQEDQGRGEAEGLAAPPALELLGEHGDERGLDRGVGEQAADQVRHLEGDRERRHRAADPEVAGGDDLADQARRRARARWRTRRRRSSARAGRARPGRSSSSARPRPRRLVEIAESSSRSLMAKTPAIVRRRPMANIASQKKRNARTQREHDENRRLTSAVKTYFRRLEAAVAGATPRPPTPSTARSARGSTPRSGKGALHRNSGARKKARAARIRAARA